MPNCCRLPSAFRTSLLCSLIATKILSINWKLANVASELCTVRDYRQWFHCSSINQFSKMYSIIEPLEINFINVVLTLLTRYLIIRLKETFRNGNAKKLSFNFPNIRNTAAVTFYANRVAITFAWKMVSQQDQLKDSWCARFS